MFAILYTASSLTMFISFCISSIVESETSFTMLVWRRFSCTMVCPYDFRTLGTVSRDMVHNRKYKIKHVDMTSQQIPSCPIIHVQQLFNLLHSTLPRTSWLSFWFLPRIPGSTRKFLGEPVNKALNSWLTKNFEKFLKPGT